MKVAIFGATGFLGRYVCNEFGKVGSTAYIANRGCEMETRHLKPMFDLGNAAYYFYAGHDDESIMTIMEGADIVVNMAGKRYETKHVLPVDKKGRLDLLKGSRINCHHADVNVAFAEKLAKLAAASGVPQFIHVSALAAAPDAKSEWARTKYAGELAVKKAFPTACIIRPATMFGHEDWFLNFYASWGERFFGNFVPLVEDGRQLVQPVYVGDVAAAIMAAAEDPEKFDGETLSLAGPAEFTREEVAYFVKDVTQRTWTPKYLPKIVAKGVAGFINNFGDPTMSPDEIELMDSNVVLDAEAAKSAGVMTFADVGIVPTPMEKIAFKYLYRYRLGGHFVHVSSYH
jgi:NADH dehydrogenase (ubiquinone) 1 alpha subcomplex subunit 9